MAVAEAPGTNENEKAVPLIGKAGRFFDSLLASIDIQRRDISVSNTVKCMLGASKATPKPEHVALCAPLWLERELELVQPKLVIAMGAVAARYLLGTAHAEITMEEVHGLPFYASEIGRPFDVFCTYHPAAGFHDSAKLGAIYDDFRDLRLFLDGKLERPRDEYPNPDYAEVDLGLWPPKHIGELAARLSCIPQATPRIALDFETDQGGQLYCWSFSTQPGTGRVVFHHQDEQASAALLKALCENAQVLKIGQNWLGLDYQLVRDLGINLVNFHDCMVRSYLLSWSPQGLKPLCRRRLGMHMDDYSDLVTRAKLRWLRERLGMILETEWPLLPPPQGTRQKKDWDLKKKVRMLLDKAVESPSYDLWSGWARLEKKIPEGLVGALVGEPPQMDLSLLPREEVIRYSARDADGHLRLWLAQEPVLRSWRMI